MSRSMDGEFCLKCKAKTQVVWDFANGDIICTECSLVLESHCIDEAPEWKTFTKDSKEPDSVRVGQPTPLLGKCDLTTFITLPNGTKSDCLPGSLAWNQNSRPISDSTLIAGFNIIDDMVD